MGTLRFHLLGNYRIFRDGISSEIKMPRVCKGVLAYMLLHTGDNYPSRDELIGTFWGDYQEEKARRNLSTTLWRLRRALEQDSDDKFLITTSSGDVVFNKDADYWLDVDVFEKHLNQIHNQSVEHMTPSDIEELESTLELYQGEPFKGIDSWEWSIRARERIRLLYINSLSLLLRYYNANQNYEKAIVIGSQILDLDPLREEIHREMMRLYFYNGQRVQAIKQYERCAEILKLELDSPPMEETLQLYSEITSAAPQNSTKSAAPKKPKDFDQAIIQFNSTVQKLRRVLEQLESDVDQVRHFTREQTNTSQIGRIERM